jgi:hypothetical protein
MRHLQALVAFVFVENDRGDTRSVPVNWTGLVPAAEADKLVETGKARFLDAVEQAPAAPPPPPTAEQVSGALQEIFPTLSDEDWGKDRVPNVRLLTGALSDHFDRRVKLTAADRDAALEIYRVANPDLFNPPVKT